ERVLQTGETQYFEEVVPQLDGLHTYVSVKFPLRDDDGAIYAMCGISTDISERKTMEAELRQSQATLATVIDSSADAILLIDREHHLVVHNAVLAQLFTRAYGVPPKLGVDVRPDLPPDIASRWHALIERALCGERLTVEETVPI